MRKSSYPTSALAMSPVIRLWFLRLLVTLGGHKNFINDSGFHDDAVAEVLGIGEWGESETQAFDAKAVRLQLRKLHQAAEIETTAGSEPSCLSNNLMRLKNLVGLSDTDCRILEFAVLIHTERLLDDLADRLGPLSTVKMFHVLSVVLGLPERDIRAALSTQGVLARAGLVSIDHNSNAMLCGKLELLSSKFADAITSSDADPVTLLRDTVTLAAPPLLQIANYDHITPALAVLRPYLKHAVKARRKGVNVYLHGPSGTGKSQLAKVLAQELGCELFEVASEDSDGDPVNGEARLRAFRAAQSFFSQRGALILFDEVEDVFNDGNGVFGKKSTAQKRKAWINRTLEENPVPTLWLSNSIAGIDPAFVRRFDMVFALPVPPKSQRQRILEQACVDLVPASTLERIAESDALAPAVVARAASVVRSIKDELGSVGAVAAFELLMDATLEAQGHRPLRRRDPNRLPTVYDPAFIHADSDLALVGTGLVQAKAGRLCLHGPPGTGKSAYARWLADRMGIPLVAKRGSDLLSMYVGGNEHNIAQAFRQAEHDGALLLIDEVDGFLQDRRGAQRGWEVSMVNEMLTQVESFPGVFVATTNLLEGLDPASLRRFDLKVKFDFLKSDQAVELLRRYGVELAIPPPTPGELGRLARLSAVTPGDFAAVIRQHRFRPIASAGAFVGALEAECNLKAGVKRAIGFY